jgi:uridine kinase
MSKSNSIRINPIIVIVAGPSCSGKTTVSQEIKAHFGSQCSIICQDQYYRSFHLREDIKDSNPDLANFDIPDALDFPLLVSHIQKLKNNQSVITPIYDFSKHLPSEDLSKKVNPTRIIVVEGTLVLNDQQLRKLSDVTIFINSDEEILLNRRIHRDCKERGRQKNVIIERYNRDVVPSNENYVIPSQEYAHYTLHDKNDFTFDGYDRMIKDLEIRVNSNKENQIVIKNK